jgi:biopolymer transport protein ExbD
VSLDRLESVLKAELEKSRSGRVVFRGDKGSTYGVFSKVMEAARKAGAKEFDLAQSPEEDRKAPDGK